MEFRKTMLALAALVIIGGLALYFGRHPEPPTTHKLLQIAPAEIAKIELHGPARDLVIERGSPGLWRIVKPVNTPADNTAVDTLAGAIANLEVLGTVGENAGDLANFGLQNPAVTITITTKDHRVLPGIMVGSTTPIGANVFLKTTDNPAVLLVGWDFSTTSNKTLNDLRSRVLVNLTADQITRIAVTHPGGGTIEVVRQGDQWKLTQPRAYPTEKAAVQLLIDTLATLQVADFIEDRPQDLEKFGLAKPALEVAVYGGPGNAKHSLAFGIKQPDPSKSAVYLRVDGGDQPVVTVAAYVVQAIDQSFDDLRDKTVFVFDESKVARMTSIGGPVSIVVERAPDHKWNVIANGRTAPAQPEVVASMLDQLHDLKGTKIVQDPLTDPQRFGMVHPNLATVLYDQTGKEIGSVNLSELEATMPPSPVPGQTPQRIGYATSSADQAVYEIPPDQVVDLENTALKLKTGAEPTPATSPSPVASAPAPPTFAASPSIPMPTVVTSPVITAPTPAASPTAATTP